MESQGMTADHHEVRAGIVQLDQEVAEVLGELDHRARNGTNRQGISRRP
jgi:hypothetical protein